MIFENNSNLNMGNVTLRMLETNHINQLEKLASDNKIWQHASEPFHESETFREKWFNKAIAQMNTKDRICFVIFQDGKMAGSSSYYEIDIDNKKLNIGYTWLHPSFWGTHLNAISKLILLDYAFNILKFNRVGFSVDSLNHHSCNALTKLGIKQEGILRNHLILSNSRIRDSVIYSVIQDEWTEIKKYIETKIEL